MRHSTLLLVYTLVIFEKSSPDIYETLLVQNSQDELENKKCIQDLTYNYQPADQELVVLNMNLNIFLNKSVISIDLSNENLVALDRSTVLYILDLRSKSAMQNFYQHLKKKYFEPRAKYLFVISMYRDRLVRKLLKALSSYFICKVLIIDKDLNIYTYFPYKYENAMDPDVESIFLGSCFNNTLSIINAEVYPKLWRNTTLHVYFRLMLPFADKEYTGSEQRIFFFGAMHLGIRLIPVLGPSTFQGIKENGTYQNKGLELLNKGIVEAVGGGYEADADLTKDFDSSSIYHIDSISLIVPRALPRKHWSRVWHTLTLEAKIGCVVSYITWNLFVYCAYNEKMINLFFLTFAIVHQTPIPKLSRYRYRIPLAFWILGLFVISNMVGNYLQQIFFTIQYEYQISSVEEIITTGLPVLVPSEIFESYNRSLKSTDKLLLSDMIVCTNEIQSCISQVCQNRSAALITSTIVIMENALSQFICLDDKTGNSLYYIGEELDQSFFQMYFIKGFPLLKALETFVRRFCLYGGIVAKERYKREADYKRALVRRELKTEALALDKIYFVFVIWGFGLAVSTVTFILEMYLPKIN